MKLNNVCLEIKDYAVSGEDFKLVYNDNLELLETVPQPEAHQLSRYYKSEDYISHTDNKRNLLEWTYHLVKRISLSRKVNLINSFNLIGKDVLDIGCGTGDFLKTAQQRGWNVLGVEPNEKARELANQKTNNKVYDVKSLYELKEKSFDVITLWHVLEHLPQKEQHIEICKKLLKPHGRIVVAVPNYKCFDASYYKKYWAGYDVPRHLWHFSQNAIKLLFQNVKMEVVKILPMKFDAFYVSLLSEKYKNGKMNFIRAFMIGLRSNLKAKQSGEYSSLIYVIKNT